MKILFLLAYLPIKINKEVHRARILPREDIFFCLRVNENPNLLVFPPPDISNFVRIEANLLQPPSFAQVKVLFVCSTVYSQTDTSKSINGPGFLVSPLPRLYLSPPLRSLPATIESSGPTSSENASQALNRPAQMLFSKLTMRSSGSWVTKTL